MNTKKIFLIAALIVLGFSLAFSSPAEKEEAKNLNGNLLFGYRFVDTNGTIERYKQDINLDEGLRLFNFSLQILPNDTFKNLFDRIDIDMNNFGGDPYETFRLAVHKTGKYRFQYNRRKSTYFYADQYMPDGNQLYDPLTFDFDRTMDNISFKLDVSKNVDFYANFDRYGKKGQSVVTMDMDRIEYEFDKPIDEDYREIALGVDFHIQKYSFVFEEKIMDYKNANSLFLPGYADGGEGASYPSSLNLFTLDQPYDLKTYTHTFKATARPVDRLLVKGYAQISDLDMDLTYSEEADGVNYIGRLFMYDSSGEGSFDRNIQLYDVDVTYLLFDKLAVIGSFRYQNFDQDGFLTIDGEKEQTTLGYNNRAIEAGLEYQFSPRMALSAGYRNDRRNLDGLETVAYEDHTTQNGLFGNFKWDVSQKFNITADYQFGDYDNPYTLISPTSFHRFRLTAKANVEAFYFSGSYLWNKSRSEVLDDLFNSTRNQLSLRAGYHSEKVKIFGGYSLIDVEHKGDRTVVYPPGFNGAGEFLWEILYEGKSNLLDASLSVELESSWRIGGYTNYYWNRGFWEIDRFTLKAYVEYLLSNGLVTQLGYRYVDFKENLSGYNDYSANIVEISFGYRWK
jgi:opacity protein-like surface antigen